MDEILNENAAYMAEIATESVELQIKRLKDREAENSRPDTFVIDFHFLVIGLMRLRKIAKLVSKISDISVAILRFDKNIPDLIKLRNGFEHIDDYIVGKGRNTETDDLRMITYIQFGNYLSWQGYGINTDVALDASRLLLAAIKEVLPI